MKLTRLSYNISSDAPGWPGNPTYRYEPVSSTDAGDVANVGILHVCNHFGTHLDAPNHFNPNGLKVAEVPLERFVYDRPLLIDLPKSDRELVTRADLEIHADALAEADVLLIRSGWSAIRSSDPHRYASEGPGVSAEACAYLIDGCPHLKAIAMDWLSLANPHRMDEGIPAHQVLCGLGRGDRYVIIIEDVNLEPLTAKTSRIYAIPLFLAQTDSSPCTVFTESADNDQPPAPHS